MDFNFLPYPSRRAPVFARRGMVATAEPNAARAGLSILEKGGSAVDAALSMATTLTVTEPTANGIGGDLFALVWDNGRLYGLNGSGRAPSQMTRAQIIQAGYPREMPTRGWLSVTVPGAPRAWEDLHQRFGRLPFSQVLAPSIQAARDGFCVSAGVAQSWQQAALHYLSLSSGSFLGWAPTFTQQGRAPAPGEIWRSPFHAETLSRIAQRGAEDFYQGSIAEKIVRFSQETGGLFTYEDLAAHQSEWVEPICASYRGHEVWEIPPNGQGIVALLALQILENFPLPRLSRDSVEAYHLQIEALKLAFADANRYVADPRFAKVPTQEMLSTEYAKERANRIQERAQAHPPGDPIKGGTVYLCAADSSGQMVSLIQSNFHGFGSGVVVPGLGVSFQNRASGFSLEEDHPNVVAPQKRPFHTIIPGFLSKGGVPIGPFGVMGGHMQPQGHIQVICNTLDWSLNPQASLDAPRWYVSPEGIVHLEKASSQALIAGLTHKGHQIIIEETARLFGRGQLLWALPGGGFVSGSEPRADGMALGF